MFRKLISWGLVIAFLGNPILEVRAAIASDGSASREQRLKERALAIPPGTMVEVKLRDKQKIRGQMGAVSDEGFTVQTAQGNKIEMKTVRFDQLKSIKKVGHKPPRIATGVAIGLVGLGILVVVIAIVCSTTSCSG
jgi:hypothetical protein